MTDISLIKAKRSDVKVILALEKQAGSKMYCARTSAQEIEDCIRRQFPFLIKNKKEIVGFVVYKVLRGKAVQLNGLAIDRRFRGRGFARQAIKLILKKVRAYPRVELLAHPYNVPALSLYLSLGFLIESWKDDYFGDGEPRLLLVRA